MLARRLPNGNLLIPRRAVSDDGTVIGDGWVEIGPDDQDWGAWQPWVEGEGRFADRPERAEGA